MAGSEILAFDYIEFSLPCHEFLWQVATPCGAAFCALVEKVQRSLVCHHYDIVYVLLLDATEKFRNGSTSSSSFISKAAEPLKGMIEKEGDKRSEYYAC
jgi:hypothetical protein